MRQFWNNEPEKRPTASHLYKKFNCTNINLFDNEFSVSEDKRHITISQLPKTYTHLEIHPETYYISRLLHFPIINQNFNHRFIDYYYLLLLNEQFYSFNEFN